MKPFPFRKISALILSFAILFCFGCGGDNSAELAQKSVNDSLSALSAQDFSAAQLSGTDSLNRTVTPVSGLKKKYVGMFYFVSQGSDEDEKIYDISELLKQYGDLGKMQNPITAVSKGKTAQYYNAAVSPEDKAHFWGEPLYGYYRAGDPWVIRKHMELFSNAGVDYIFLDYTNNIIYEQQTKNLLDVILEMQKAGLNPPKVTFLLSRLPGDASYTFITQLKPAFFSDDTYASCWFRADPETNPSGDPLVIGNFSTLGEYGEGFWLKQIQWPGETENPDAIPWIDKKYPQTNHGGVMNVSVAQGVDNSSDAYYSKSKVYRARGWSSSDILNHGTDETSVLSGTNFQSQWDYAIGLGDAVNMVTVTGWNEWTVRKLLPTDPASNANDDYGVFVDSFNAAYSRDIEMTKGGYGDNYYMQLVQNIRRFKGQTVEKSDNVMLSEKKTPSLSDPESWNGAIKYLDLGAPLAARNYTAVDRSITYTDNTNRNDIDSLRVCNDGENLYVETTCKTDIEKYVSGDSSYMNLYLDCGVSGGWENYDFVINRSFNPASGTASVERFTGTGSATSLSGTAQVSVSGKTIRYAIPLSMLGLKSGAVIGVKAADHLKTFGDAEDLFVSGDCAPLGRLNYAYKIA